MSAEIIPGPWEDWRKKELQNESKEDKSPPDFEVADRLNLDQATRLLEFMSTILHNSSGDEKRKLKTRYRDLVAGYTEKEIIGQINNSNRLQWKAHASFFNAILIEARRRGLLGNK